MTVPRGKRRVRKFWEIKRELRRRLLKLKPYQVNAFATELREFAIALNFYRDRDAIKTIEAFGIAKAYSADDIERAIRQQGQVKQ